MALTNSILDGVKAELEAYSFDKEATVQKQYFGDVKLADMDNIVGYLVVVCINESGVKTEFHCRRHRKKTFPVEVYVREKLADGFSIPVGLTEDLSDYFDKRVIAGIGTVRRRTPDPQYSSKDLKDDGIYSGKLLLNVEVIVRK